MKHRFGLPSVQRRRPRTPGPMFCRACGYQLDNLPEPRCPECGTAFDPSDRTTFLEEPIDSAARTAASVSIGLVAVAIVAALIFAVIFLLSIALATP